MRLYRSVVVPVAAEAQEKPREDGGRFVVGDGKTRLMGVEEPEAETVHHYARRYSRAGWASGIHIEIKVEEAFRKALEEIMMGGGGK